MAGDAATTILRRDAEVVHVAATSVVADHNAGDEFSVGVDRFDAQARIAFEKTLVLIDGFDAAQAFASLPKAGDFFVVFEGERRDRERRLWRRFFGA